MMKNNLPVIVVRLLSIFAISNIGHAAMREFVIIDKTAPATLQEAPNGTSSIVKIPAGTKIEIKSKKDIRSGRLVVTWYEVNYKGQNGWISQYVTMGDIIKKDESGKESSSRVEGADKVRLGNFNGKAKEDFKKWALNNTAVTYFMYPEGSDWQIWVRLTPDKYTTKENVESIALHLAKSYKLQTGFDKLVIVTVWHPYKNEVFADSRL